uniref:Pacifastin domain-containing protein n=1 Tax=Anopheles albimanus TaxID=7167 RepID=A0A182FLI3_ANOAL
MKVLILIVATLAVGALCSEQCVPGTTFKEDCNTCRCGENGLKACTRKMCTTVEAVVADEPYARNDNATTTGSTTTESITSADEKEEVAEHTNGQVCTPNEIKMKDCNRCRCANNGIGWFCTRKACPPREKRSVEQEECSPGTTFESSDGCSECICTPDSKAVCTDKPCEARTKRNTNSGDRCAPGTSFKSADGCNDCYCTENGRAACTLKACEPNPIPYRRRRRSPSATKQDCVPGTTFKDADGCNDCFCSSDGRAACTLMACEPHPAPYKRNRRSSPVKTECTPGETKKADDGCNDCHCTNDGRLACTRMACAPAAGEGLSLLFKREAPSPRKQECVPGTSFKDSDGCNDCFCTDDGQAACTLKACEPNPAPYKRNRRSSPVKTECTPGETKKADDGCNDCHCTNDGRLACTRMACAPAAGEGLSLLFKREAPSSRKQECVPGTSFKDSDGCNDCFCTDDGQAACTLKACEPNPVPYKRRRRASPPKPELAPSQECVPGTTFKDADGCNDCFCSNDGRAACTLKLCLPNEAASYSGRHSRSPQTESKCTPGETKTHEDGCNQCTCTNDGRYACTRMACAPADGEGMSLLFKREAPLLPTAQCTPGETRMHEDGCNKCRCTSAGVLACTRKWCDHGNEKKSSSVHKREATTELPRSELAPGSPGFSCTPRSSFKYQCNNCVCNDDGKNAGCTFKFCIPGEY